MSTLAQVLLALLWLNMAGSVWLLRRVKSNALVILAAYVLITVVTTYVIVAWCP